MTTSFNAISTMKISDTTCMRAVGMRDGTQGAGDAARGMGLHEADRRYALELRLVGLAHAIVRHTHERHVEHDEPSREVTEPRSVDNALERHAPPAGAGRALLDNGSARGDAPRREQ